MYDTESQAARRFSGRAVGLGLISVAEGAKARIVKSPENPFAFAVLKDNGKEYRYAIPDAPTAARVFGPTWASRVEGVYIGDLMAVQERPWSEFPGATKFTLPTDAGGNNDASTAGVPSWLLWVGGAFLASRLLR